MYTFESHRSDHRATANRRRIEAVEAFSTEPADRIIKGILMRGIQINLTAADRNFASQGDLYLFGSVLDTFLSMYASMNSFTQFALDNSQTGERILWPPRLGEKPLL
jgi:type VI secretion system protein ImpG